MRAFGIFFSAKRPSVFLCLAILTHPNFPSPNFFPSSNSSMGEEDDFEGIETDVFLGMQGILERDVVAGSGAFFWGSNYSIRGEELNRLS